MGAVGVIRFVWMGVDGAAGAVGATGGVGVGGDGGAAVGVGVVGGWWWLVVFLWAMYWLYMESKPLLEVSVYSKSVYDTLLDIYRFGT